MNNITLQEEKLLQKINSCANPRRVFAVLSSLIGEPDIKDIDDAGKKRKISLSKITAFIDEATAYKEVV